MKGGYLWQSHVGCLAGLLLALDSWWVSASVAPRAQSAPSGPRPYSINVAEGDLDHGDSDESGLCSASPVCASIVDYAMSVPCRMPGCGRALRSMIRGLRHVAAVHGPQRGLSTVGIESDEVAEVNGIITACVKSNEEA